MPNLYEHTIIFKQELPTSKINELVDKYSQIITTNKGKIVKTEDWGIMNFSRLIKKNKKGYYYHFKFEGGGQIVNEIEKNETIDNNLLRFLTVRVKKFDLENQYFNRKEGQ